jgi:hypothetical protein
MYCFYYQARIKRSHIGFITAVIKSFEHLCFDRTVCKEDEDIQVLEFFVPQDNNDTFCDIFNYFVSCECLLSYEQHSNRLKDPHSSF